MVDASGGDSDSSAPSDTGQGKPAIEHNTSADGNLETLSHSMS